MSKQFNIRDMPERSDEQLRELVEWTGHTKVQIMLMGLDRFHQEVGRERERSKAIAEHPIQHAMEETGYCKAYSDGFVATAWEMGSKTYRLRIQQVLDGRVVWEQPYKTLAAMEKDLHDSAQFSFAGAAWESFVPEHWN